MKVCSALSGNCLPEHNAGVHDSWYECAMAEMGPDLVNRNKIYVTFKCKQANET